MQFLVAVPKRLPAHDGYHPYRFSSVRYGVAVISPSPAHGCAPKLSLEAALPRSPARVYSTRRCISSYTCRQSKLIQKRRALRLPFGEVAELYVLRLEAHLLELSGQVRLHRRRHHLVSLIEKKGGVVTNISGSVRATSAPGAATVPAAFLAASNSSMTSTSACITSCPFAALSRASVAMRDCVKSGLAAPS